MPRATVDGWEFAYDEAGSGPAVVLLHGLLMDRTMWDHQVGALRDAYRVVTVDAPGHGDSPGRPRGFTAWDEAAALAKLADALGIDRAVWIGHSMGGFKAVRLALSDPDRVRGLVLVDSSAGPESPDLLPQYEAFLEVAKESGVTEDLAGLVTMIMFGPEAAGSLVGEHWRKRWMSLDPQAIEGTCRLVFDRDDVTGRIGGLGMPVLIIHGADAVAISVEVAGRTAETLGARLVEVAGSGHTSPVERPAEVSTALRAFLDALP